MLTLIPLFLIISSSVYPAIISGIQNKEMAIITDAVAQLQEKNSRGDSSGYHANIPVSDTSSSLSPSPTPTTSAPSFIASDTANNNNNDYIAQAAISSVTARPTNNIVNTNSFYDIVFVTSTSGVIKRIQVTFPAGTTVPSSASFNEVEGLSPGTVSKSGQTLTYTVTNAVNVPAGAKIRLEFANINNPTSPSTNYKVTVTTRNAANTVIDGPTQSTAYTMKQIGSNAIADKAIKDTKLTLDSVYTVWADGVPRQILYQRGTVAFDQREDLSNTEVFSEVPAVAASGNNVYVVWQEGSIAEIFYKRSTNGGFTFGSTINLSNNGGDSEEPAIAASGNNVYVVWHDNTPGNTEILYKKSTDGGGSFSSTINISSNLGSSFSPAVATSGNNVYIVWVDDTPGNFDILYSRSTNGGVSFGLPINLSNNAGSSTGPTIAASGNNVYVVWHDNTPGNNEIVYKRSINGGASFSSNVNLSNNAGSSTGPAIAASGNNVYAVWTDITPGNSEIFYRRSTNGGASFDSTKNLSNNAVLSSDPAVAALGNNIYLVWHDESFISGEIAFRKSTNSGASFGSIINLSNTDNANSNDAAVAAVNNLPIGN